MNMENCIFCQIAAGTAPAHKIWEDDKHLAFLSIFPNTEGFSVVIPKAHHDSNALRVPDDVLTGLVLAAKQVAALLDEKLDDVGRTGLIFEGFGVNHLHAKLFPMHGTKSGEWERHKAQIDTYFPTYPGYISSNDSKRADDTQLAELANRIRS